MTFGLFVNYLFNYLMLIHLAILHIQSPDLHQVSIVSAILSDELSDHCHGLGAVHCKAGVCTKVCLVSLSPMVVVTPILVTDPIIPVVTGIVSTLQSLTPVLT